MGLDQEQVEPFTIRSDWLIAEADRLEWLAARMSDQGQSAALNLARRLRARALQISSFNQRLR